MLPYGHQWIAWRWRGQFWPRVILAVKILAETGVSTALDLLLLLSQKTGSSPRANSLRNVVYGALADEQVAHRMVEYFAIKLPGTAPVKLSVLRLTDYGKSLARALGVEPVESDWEKIVRLHKGEEQEGHAALVLMAAYQARLRGWKAEVMPFDPQETPWFQPDLKLTDPEGWFYYCEVETRSRDNPEKWMRMRQANLIVPMPITRYWMVERLKAMGIPGRATDLRTLAQQAKAGDLSRFWLEKW
ncbi:MAG: hypothetical protein ACPLRM_08990 [Anaerolineae bacterium]